jgi:hypothetical protein
VSDALPVIALFLVKENPFVTGRVLSHLSHVNNV